METLKRMDEEERERKQRKQKNLLKKSGVASRKLVPRFQNRLNNYKKISFEPTLIRNTKKGRNYTYRKYNNKKNNINNQTKNWLDQFICWHL